MAGYKVLTASLTVLFAVSGASALQVDINIQEITDHGAYEFDYRDNVTSFQEMNVTVENLGSIGCTYRMRAVLEGENFSEIAHSEGYELWPGDTALMTVRHLPLNYTGKVQSDVYLNYCGQEKLIEQVNYSIENRQSTNNTLESETLEANASGARIRTEEVQEGVMIPEETPAGWEVSSSMVEEGVASASYSAPIFDKRRNITYSVVRPDGELVGTTDVNLNPEITVTEMLKDNVWKILLLISLMFNLGLLYTHKVKPLSEK
ncbi:MAG: hypothetical protein ACI8Z7_000153 [Candidatus Nanohaloarchaea archaeon]|jgi:hypothetical protein